MRELAQLFNLGDYFMSMSYITYKTGQFDHTIFWLTLSKIIFPALIPFYPFSRI